MKAKGARTKVVWALRPGGWLGSRERAAQHGVQGLKLALRPGTIATQRHRRFAQSICICTKYPERPQSPDIQTHFAQPCSSLVSTSAWRSLHHLLLLPGSSGVRSAQVTMKISLVALTDLHLLLIWGIRFQGKDCRICYSDWKVTLT